MVVGIDLQNMELEAFRTYLKTRKPICGIISIPCIGSKDTPDLKGEFGGQVALFQLNNDAHFIAEHPHGSDMWELPSWKKVLADPRTRKCVVHQCMTNLRDRETNLRVKKPTDFVASDKY